MASNCYGYALRIDRNPCPGTSNGKDSPLENWSDGLDDYPFIENQAKILIKACISDGLREFDAAQKKIAVFLHKYDECIDYHFYRQDENGSWSCQDSTDGPIKVGIQDPVEYDKTLVNKELSTGVLKDQMYAGTLYLPSGVDMGKKWE